MPNYTSKWPSIAAKRPRAPFPASMSSVRGPRPKSAAAGYFPQGYFPAAYFAGPYYSLVPTK